MTPKRKKELRRIDVGFQIIGGVNSPIGAFIYYQVDWSDGTTSIERGRAVHTMPGILPVGTKLPEDVIPHLASHMRAIQALLDPIRQACFRLDLPKKRKKAKNPAPGTGAWFAEADNQRK